MGCQGGVADAALWDAIDEIERELVDADPGGRVMKKRVALGNRGKSGGVRTLLVYRVQSKAFFVYGFAKHARTNIKDDELKALRRYATELLGYSDSELNKALRAGELIEVKSDG